MKNTWTETDEFFDQITPVDVEIDNRNYSGRPLSRQMHRGGQNIGAVSPGPAHRRAAYTASVPTRAVAHLKII